MPHPLLTIRLYLICLSLMLASCKMTSSVELEQTSFADPVALVDNVDEVVLVDHSETSLFETEDLGDGFCKDDIYATHLRREHLSTVENKLRTVRSTAERRRINRAKEIEGIFFARSRLVGSTPGYYGALPVVSNPEVEFWIRYFNTRGRQTFLRWLIRSQSVRELVGPILQDQGMPEELFFLAMIESGFNNTAKSHARAVGPWQFMAGTARLYGLKINHWVDERRDPVKATIAAANYLRDLYRQFGDWYLAMAAYNAGPGRVRSAIRRSGSRDFWTIAKTSYLANETKQYVPKVLAAIIVSNNLEDNGFIVAADPEDKTPETVATLSRPVQLQELSAKLGLSQSQLLKWNPELVNTITPPVKDGQSGYPLRLPQEHAAKFASIEPELTYLEVRDVQMHRISQGETLSHIARRYKVSIRAILTVNPRIKPNRLQIGRQIAIPIPGVVKVASAKAD